MSIFVILGLLVCIEAQGSTAVTDVFVKKGEDVLLNVTEADVPQDFFFVEWKFNTNILLVRFFPAGKPAVPPAYNERIEFPMKNYSFLLKNLQDTDSGAYTSLMARGAENKILSEYNVTVQAPVSPATLTMDSVSTSSVSCNLTVSCRAQDAHISSTFTCDTQTCSQEGGERSEVTTSGSVLHVYLGLNDAIICNHSNQVSWTRDMTKIQNFCLRHIDSESLSADVTVCMVKQIVFSVGLIIMVSAVITVHLIEKLQKKNESSSLTTELT